MNGPIEGDLGTRSRIGLAATKLAIITVAFLVNFVFLFAAFSAWYRHEELSERYAIYYLIVFGGMLLTAVAILFSTVTALGIGWITLGCALAMPFMRDEMDMTGMLVAMAAGPACIV